jgi:hypothetical protein
MKQYFSPTIHPSFISFIRQMKKNLVFSRAVWVAVLVFHGLIHLYGQTAGPKISMQGTLTDAAGQSVADGKYTITFRLYTEPAGGTRIWQETSEVTVDNAIYSHYLGSVVELNPAIFVNKLYLGLQLGNSDEITPRTELTYVPYAFAVNTANTVVCSGAVGDVKYSILDPVKFAAENGSCWVPMNGAALPSGCALRQLTGMTSLPDAGGLFIRGQEFTGGQDNDPDRSPTSDIATVQGDAFKSHTHTVANSGYHTHNYLEYQVSGGNVGFPTAFISSNAAVGNDQLKFTFSDKVLPEGNHTHGMSSTGGAETRVSNLNFWIYIRIN